MENFNLQDKINSIKNLKNYKKKTPQELETIAIKMFKKDQMKVDWVGMTKDEIKVAQKSFENYIENHHIESFNDLEDLKTLVYNSILENRLKQKIFELTTHEDADGNSKPEIPNKNILDSLTGLQKQMLDLKQKLGLNESKTEGWMQFWARLCKKINTHAVEHRGAFTFKCVDPNCGKIALLLRKIDDYNTFEFKCFRGTFIYSEPLMKMIDEKRTDFKEAASIFGCGEEYMQGMFQKIYLREKKHVKK